MCVWISVEFWRKYLHSFNTETGPIQFWLRIKLQIQQQTCTELSTLAKFVNSILSQLCDKLDNFELACIAYSFYLLHILLSSRFKLIVRR